ncbi:MAG: hypothetical protein GY943_10185 [Chloroflexi bacterium]|nr:hypothetical protein [Chloroflexota bacterium]
MVKQKAWFGPSQWGWALLIIVIATAVFLRFYQLGEVPPGLYRDEAFNGLDALGVINGRHALFFTTNNGREPAYIYLTSLFIRWFGRTPLAVRMGAAVIGSATAWLTYQMAAEWFDKRVGLLAAWLWAVTLWPLHLSRIGLRPILLPFALAAAAWLCAVDIDNKNGGCGCWRAVLMVPPFTLILRVDSHRYFCCYFLCFCGGAATAKSCGRDWHGLV